MSLKPFSFKSIFEIFSFIFDMLIFIFGIGKLFNIEKIKNFFLFLDNRFPLFLICIVFIVFSLIFFLFGFNELAKGSGDNPQTRRWVFSLFIESSIKLIFSIFSFIIFIILKGKGKIILYIIISIFLIILIFLFGKLIYKLMKLIIDKIHGI